MFSFYLNQPYLFHVDKNSAELIRNVSAESSRLVDTIRSLLILAIEVFILIFILDYYDFYNRLSINTHKFSPFC